MNNQHKLYILLAALVIALVAVVYANMNGSMLQGYLRAPATETRSSSEELKVSPLSFERTISSLDAPIEIAGFRTDRSLKVQEIGIKVSTGAFAVDSLRLYLNKADLANSVDKASLDFLTCPHCTFKIDQPIDAKIRFVKPIEINAGDQFLVEMVTDAIESEKGNLESEITSVSEVLANGSIKVYRVDDLRYIIKPAEDVREREEEYTIEDSDMTLTADSEEDRERTIEAGRVVDLAGFRSDSRYSPGSVTFTVDGNGGATFSNVTVWIDDTDVTLKLTEESRSSLEGERSSGTFTAVFGDSVDIDAGSRLHIRATIDDIDDTVTGSITTTITEVREAAEDGRVRVREIEAGEIEYTIEVSRTSDVREDDSRSSDEESRSDDDGR